MNKLDFKSKQQGMTLVEIMIAMMLGLFLLVGAIQIFQGSSQSYRMLENLSRMQENGRFAMDFISRDIRMGDYWGCLNKGLDNVSNNEKPLYGITNGLIGIEGGAGNSDGFAIAGGVGDSIDVASQATVTSNIFVAAGNDLTIGEAVFITDCEQGDIFTIEGITAGTELEQDISGGQDITAIYTDGGMIHHLAATIYFIQGGALQRTINGVTNELVEGIEDMQILYGEDINDDKTPDYYVDADNVVDMDQVISVRVNLLVVSADNNLSISPVAYEFNGNTATPASGDRRLRREYSSTIAVRNRLP